MGLFDNIAKRYGYEKSDAPNLGNVEKSADFATGGSWGDIFGGGSGGFKSFNSQKEQLQAYVDWVYAAVRYIAETCSTVDLRIFENHTGMSKATLSQKMIYHPLTLQKQLAKYGKKTVIEMKDGKLITRQAAPLEELETHPLLELLDSPNPFMTRMEFFEMTFLHMELAGEAFWAINRKSKNGPPTELWPLTPSLVSVVSDPEKFILGYTYTVDGKQLPFAPEDIIHHRYSDPQDFRRGMSSVSAAARIIDTDSHMADHNRRIFYNGATVDAVLYTDQKLNDENWKRLNSQWADKYSGSAQAHKTAILENGLKYQPMALNNRDLDFLAGMNYNRDMILAIFGVPKSLLGMDESMSRANAEAAEYAFSKNKVRSKMMRLTARITQDLAPQFGDNIIVSFTDPVPDDKEFLLKEKQASVGNTNQTPWRTINEIRAEDGDDPMEGGDELWIQGTLVPVAYAAQEPTPEDKPAVAEETGDAPDNNDSPSDEEGSEDHDDGGDGTTSSDTGNNGSSSSGGNNSSAGDAGSTSSDSSSGSKTIKQVSADDYPHLYDDLGIDVSKLGCIMMDVEDQSYEELIPNYEDDLSVKDMSDENSGAIVPTQHGSHVTLLYGLLENGNKWKDKVDTLLKGWNMPSVQFDHVDAFDLKDSYAIVAHVKKSDELVDGHERLTLLPHIQTHSEYKPHVTLAYVKHDKRVANKWVKTLNAEFSDKVVKTIGLNYGRPEVEDQKEEEAESKGLKAEEVKCICCEGAGEHLTGFECYRCDACGLESEAVGPVPCDGREDSPNIVQNPDGSYDHKDASEFTLKHLELTQQRHINQAKSDHEAFKDILAKDFTNIRDKVSNKYEDDFLKVAYERFEDQKKEVLRNVEKTFKGYKVSPKGITKAQKKDVNNLFNKAKSIKEWVKKLLPIYRGAVNTSGNAAFQYVAGSLPNGTSQQFSGADPEIVKFYEQRTTIVSVGIDDTTDRLLKTTLIEGISSGEGVGKLMDRVEEVYNAAAGYRALRIARTEAIDSTTFATISAWKQSNVVSGKEWKVGVSDPCPFCASQDGKIIGLSENYFNKGDSLTVGNQTMKFNYDDVDGPPAHPNCRCSILPVLVGQ